MWATEDSHTPLITTVQVNGYMVVVIALKGPNEIAQGNALGNSTKNQVLKGRKVLFAGHRAPLGLFWWGMITRGCASLYPGLSHFTPSGLKIHRPSFLPTREWCKDTAPASGSENTARKQPSLTLPALIHLWVRVEHRSGIGLFVFYLWVMGWSWRINTKAPGMTSMGLF